MLLSTFDNAAGGSIAKNRKKKYKKCGNNHFNYFNFKKQNN